MIHRVSGIPVAQIRHAVLRVVLAVFQRHAAAVGDGVVLRAVVGFVNAFRLSVPVMPGAQLS